jgi:hypothetical protein
VKKTTTLIGIILVIANASLIYLILTADPFDQPRTLDLLFFTDENCRISCWQGLRVSQSSAMDVVRLLGNEPFEILEWTRTPDGVALIYARHERGWRISAGIQNDALQFLEITGSGVDMDASDVIAVLGEPEYVSIGYSPSMQFDEYEAFMTLFYPQQGYVFRLQNSPGLRARLNQNREIEICGTQDAWVVSVQVTESGSIDELRTRSRYYNEPNLMLETWSGFGCVIVSP